MVDASEDLDDLWDDEEEDREDLYLTFRLGQEVYGIHIHDVTEIIGVQKITEVPDVPDFVRGVINLRGKVIPVMDMRARFRMEGRGYDERTCIVVVSIRETMVGLIVDTVNEVLNIPDESISPPPAVARGHASRYIQGMGRIGDQVKILLDVDKLLFEQELERIEAL